MKYKVEGTYRLEMIIFRNFKGTKDEALDELQGDVEAFENGDAGWFSENYMPESPLVDKLTTESEDEYNYIVWVGGSVIGEYESLNEAQEVEADWTLDGYEDTRIELKEEV